MKAILVLLPIGVLLGNCAGHVPVSVDGQCGGVFTDPGFAVQGKRVQDKRWIGATQEKGIEVCGWKRPRAAPVAKHHFVKAHAVQIAPAPAVEPEVVPAPLPPASAAPAPVKRHWYSIFHKKPKTQ